MLRRTGYVALAALAVACVPSEDQSNNAAATGSAAQGATPPTPPRLPGTPRLSRPLPPIPPSANPFVYVEASAPPPREVANPNPNPDMAGAPPETSAEPVASAAPAAVATHDAGIPHVLRDAGPATVAVRTGDAGAPAKPAAAPDSVIAAYFLDTFDRPDLGADWNTTSPEWKIQGGRLCGRNAHNHPAWLKRKLPVNARIEFDATSSAPDGDLKVELWGDGKSFAKGTSYNDATSYIAILGGWKNQFHVLAKVDEHAPDRPQVKVDPSGADDNARPVQVGRSYHVKVERSDGKTVRWLVDDIEVLSFADPQPFKGDGHDHLGFNDWEVPVCFDNLQITPLPGG